MNWKHEWLAEVDLHTGNENKLKMASRGKKLQSHVQKFDVIEVLANALSGISTDQLPRGDAVDEQKEPKEIFLSKAVSIIVNSANTRIKREKRILTISPVRVHGTECLALLETGAFQN